MIETEAFGSTVHSQKKNHDCAYDALLLSISNDHQATIVLVGENLVILMTFCSTDITSYFTSNSD